MSDKVLHYIITLFYLLNTIQLIFSGFISKLSSVSFESFSRTSSLRCYAALVRSNLPSCQNGQIGRPGTSVNKTTNQSCVTTRNRAALMYTAAEAWNLARFRSSSSESESSWNDVGNDLILVFYFGARKWKVCNCLSALCLLRIFPSVKGFVKITRISRNHILACHLKIPPTKNRALHCHRMPSSTKAGIVKQCCVSRGDIWNEKMSSNRFPGTA